MAAKFTVCDVRNDRIIANDVELRKNGWTLYWDKTEYDFIGLEVYDAILVNEDSIIVWTDEGLFQIVLTNGEWSSMDNLYKACRKSE